MPSDKSERRIDFEIPIIKCTGFAAPLCRNMWMVEKQESGIWNLEKKYGLRQSRMVMYTKTRCAQHPNVTTKLLMPQTQQCILNIKQQENTSEKSQYVFE